MKTLMMTTGLALLLAPVAISQPPLTESEDSQIGYSTVAEARAALGERKDVTSHVESGWTIFVDENNLTIWSFSPLDHPSHPTAVKRQILPVGDASRLVMGVSCESTKTACDAIVREFSAMNGIKLDE